jgi:hypothetical protein
MTGLSLMSQPKEVSQESKAVAAAPLQHSSGHLKATVVQICAKAGLTPAAVLIYQTFMLASS